MGPGGRDTYRKAMRTQGGRQQNAGQRVCVGQGEGARSAVYSRQKARAIREKVSAVELSMSGGQCWRRQHPE